MSKFVFLLLLVFLTSQVKSTEVKASRDLLDQVAEELEALRNIVQGSIAAAQNDLSSREYDFLAKSDNVLATGEISIEEEQQTINEQLIQIKELASVSGIDITPCISIREILLNQLPGEYKDQLRYCVFNQNRQEALLVMNAKYIIDVTINKVHNLEFQIRQCIENLLCISPLLTEIELDKIRLVENIRTEVDAFDGLLLSLELLVQGCSDTNVSLYVGDVRAVINDIIICVNGMLG